MQQLRWRTSSYSGAVNNCVQLAELDTVAAIRDSKHPAGPVLTVTRAALAAFTAGIKAGEFE